MRRRCCHDKIYSGKTSLECKFEYICMRCGQCGWDHTVKLDQVNVGLYRNLRLIHGWPQQIFPVVNKVELRQKATRANKRRRRAGWLLLSTAAYVVSLVLVGYALIDTRVILQVSAALLAISSLLMLHITFNRWRHT